ncbi:peptidoglycan DD-metalloendopeptidase family protein [Gammaproteobacteria bacterium]|nr:peptidoglycan DD-metalloendopeptidase family protein [Gammaproteobacteria bacterium]
MWCILVSGAIALPAHASDSPQVDLNELRQRIKLITRTLNQDKAELNAVHEALARVETTMSELNRRIHEVQSSIEVKTGKINDSATKIVKLEQDLMVHRGQLRNLIVASYVTGRAEYFKLLLNQEDPSVVGRNIAYYQFLSRRRVDDILEFEELVDQLHLVKSSLDIENEELRAMQAAQLSQRNDLSEAQIQRNALIARLERDIGSNRQQLVQLKNNASRLERLLQNLNSTAPDGLPDSAMNLRFGGMRGRLRLPVRGTISAYFGQFRKGTNIPWQGIFMDTGEGTEVHAIFPGRVAFADWLRGFGLLLILDHGDGFMSLYSHNQLLFKQIGEWVDTSTPIAQAGSSGGLTKAGLYFEIRQNGVPRDPLIWCKVE